ncbi:putative RNA-binding Zn ribbon-like protein [Paraburkholderia sp. WSM4175]|uniref:CGNR zinc finger domain-containing protein n=1 Tax=Paraburkholderia sp. WSM4175 TaxID=2991072 RepID=UPI003D2307B3
MEYPNFGKSINSPKKLGRQADLGLGGHLVLNFVNTCGGAGKERDADRWVDWRTALNWAGANGLLSPSESRLVEKARLHAGLSESDVLKELTELREAVHAVFSAIATGASCSEPDRMLLENHIREALNHANLCVAGREPAHWTVLPEKAGSALIKDRLAVAATELFMQPMLSNVRECGACSWLFLDLSRSKSRRWCSMATCGNRVKAQRHYRAVRATG